MSEVDGRHFGLAVALPLATTSKRYSKLQVGKS